MPEYTYECQNEECGLMFSVVQGIKDNQMRKCPHCEQKTLERVILTAPYAFVRQEPTTVGQLGERNAKKMGKHGLELARKNREAMDERMRQERKEAVKKKLPPGAKLLEHNGEAAWYGDAPEKVKKAAQSGDKDKVHKYIMTGEE